MEAALKELAGQDQAIITGHLMEEMSFKAIAERLGSKEATVRSRYFRALEQLRGVFPPDMLQELADEGKVAKQVPL